MRRTRKAWVAGLLIAAGPTWAALQQVAEDGQISVADVVAVVSTLLAALGAGGYVVYRTPNAGQIDVASLTADETRDVVRLGLISRDDAAAARGQKPA